MPISSGPAPSTTLKTVPPTSSLVTGYEFLTDSSNAVKNQLQLGTGATPDSLINDTWTADQLRTQAPRRPEEEPRLPRRPLRRRRGPRAPTTRRRVSSTRAAAGVASTSRTRLVFSTGCHAGYNVVDGDGDRGRHPDADWAQVLARKGATLVAGTGFQYGDDELVEYSERVYAEFAHQLRVGSGPVSVGNALVKSKLAYLAATPETKGMHQKALLTASVFGLPMFAVEHARDTRH